MTDFKKEAEKVAEKIAYDWNRFPGCTMHKNDIKPDIAAALERVAKEGEIRGMEVAMEVANRRRGRRVFTAEAAGYRMAELSEILVALQAEIARMKGTP